MEMFLKIVGEGTIGPLDLPSAMPMRCAHYLLVIVLHPSSAKLCAMGVLGINGPRLFNSLPNHIRNLSGIQTLDYKKELDKFLKTIADELLSCGYTSGRRAASNSLLHMIPASM